LLTLRLLTNLHLLFAGENYLSWKVKMQIFLEFVDRGIWDEVSNGPFFPIVTVNDVQIQSPFLSGLLKLNMMLEFEILFHLF